MKKILIVKPTLTIPRYHFNRSLELSKYFDITYLILNSYADNNRFFNDYKTEKHKIIFLNKPIKRGVIKSSISIIRFYLCALKFIKENHYDLIKVDISRFCFLIPLLNSKRNYVLQTYTSTVSKSKIKNYLLDKEKEFNLAFYRKILVGTDWMVNKFQLHKKEVYVINWGTKPLSNKVKSFKNMRLLYLGTLNNRSISVTIEGLSIFLRNNPNIDVEYDIIGTGKKNEVKNILESIDKHNLKKIIHYHGFVEDDHLGSFFDRCNIGIAFIPLKEYYNNVVATKLYEYYVSGLFTIATRTMENQKIINKNNGILVNDSSVGFSKGLEYIKTHLNEISSELIFRESKKHTLSYNARKYMVPIFNNLISTKNIP